LDRYKERFKADPNIGAVYGHVAADLTVTGLGKAGADFTLESFVKGLESIHGYGYIFNGPEVPGHDRGHRDPYGHRGAHAGPGDRLAHAQARPDL
jgi:hypothetical protein